MSADDGDCLWQTWPGILLLLLFLAGAAALITYGALTVSDAASINNRAYEERVEGGRKIQDGKDDDGTLVSDDGQVGNPKVYPDMGCELPNYVSKNRQIYAVAANGTEVAVGIKGVNWFGMETYELDLECAWCLWDGCLTRVLLFVQWSRHPVWSVGEPVQRHHGGKPSFAMMIYHHG